MTVLKDILILLTILVCFGIASSMDYEDAVREEEYLRSRRLELGACDHAARAHAREDSSTSGDSPREDLARDCATTPL